MVNSQYERQQVTAKLFFEQPYDNVALPHDCEEMYLRLGPALRNRYALQTQLESIIYVFINQVLEHRLEDLRRVHRQFRGL